MRSSFVLYTSWGPMIEEMSAEQAGELLKACYALERGDEFEIKDPTVRIVFATVKATMIEDRDKYEQVSEKRRQAALSNKSEQMQANADKCSVCSDLLYDNESDNDNESDKDIKRKTEQKEKPAVFVKPTIEEVREYCNQRGNSVDPEAFMDFYASKGWKVGNQTMKDWKAAVRTWEKREKKTTREPPKPKWQYQDQRKYDYDDLERRLLAR